MLAAHSTWFADQILNAGPWIVADVIYLDDVCGGGSVSPATLNAIVEFMYTGRKYMRGGALKSRRNSDAAREQCHVR